MSRTKLPHLLGIEMAKIPSAEEVGLPIGCGVQHSVVGGVRQHEWADDHWLDDAGHIGQALGEPRSFVRSNSITGSCGLVAARTKILESSVIFNRVYRG